MDQPRILLVESQEPLRWALREHLQAEHYRVDEARSAQEAVEAMEASRYDLVLLAQDLPDRQGLSLLPEIWGLRPNSPVVLMSIDDPARPGEEPLSQTGSLEFVRKPVDMPSVLRALRRALEVEDLRKQVDVLLTPVRDKHRFEKVLGQNAAFVRVREEIRRLATSPADTILFTGESGTGKEYLARCLHYQSPRASHPFVTVTCVVSTPLAFEEAFFGRDATGSGTNGHSSIPGALEEARGGTVYLREISKLPLETQAKMVAFLDTRTFTKVNGSRELRADARVIATTTVPLDSLVKQGEFREDLYYRLRRFPVVFPTLRERGAEDVRELLEYFLAHYNDEFGTWTKGFTPEALDLLVRYEWPGNNPELARTVASAILRGKSDWITPGDLPSHISSEAGEAPVQDGDRGFRLPGNGLVLANLEKDLVRQALQRTGGNQVRAAALLGINRDQIRYRIQKFGLRRTVEEALTHRQL